MACLSIACLLCLAALVPGFVLPSGDQIALLGFSESENKIHHQPKAADGQNPPRVAIIGSGITGASAAFQLYEGGRVKGSLARQPQITVFERSPIVGGRITQTYVYGDPLFPIDSCAATYSIFDTCVVTLATDVGLTLQEQIVLRPKQAFGLWNGHEMLAVEENFRMTGTWSEYREDKWYERWGNTPRQLFNEVTLLRQRFNMVLGGAVRTNLGPSMQGRPNLTAELELAQLTEDVKSPACSEKQLPEVLQSPGGKRFGRDIVNAGSRERFFADREQLNQLEFLLGFENALPTYVVEGNLQLIERLLKLSTQDVRLGTEVQKVERLADKGFTLTSLPTGGGAPITEEFDIVILGSSLALANITFEPELPKKGGLEQKYLDSYITHFTSPSRLNASYFNRTATMPQNILTTTSGAQNSSVPFFSLTLLGRYQQGQTVDNLYKIVSREEVPFGDIQDYLEGDAEITWIDREQQPQSVPVEPQGKEDSCRGTLEEIELVPGLFYAGGGEQVIASVEFGCRMGANAANLILQPPPPMKNTEV